MTQQTEEWDEPSPSNEPVRQSKPKHKKKCIKKKKKTGTKLIQKPMIFDLDDPKANSDDDIFDRMIPKRNAIVSKTKKNSTLDNKTKSKSRPVSGFKSKKNKSKSRSKRYNK